MKSLITHYFILCRRSWAETPRTQYARRPTKYIGLSAMDLNPCLMTRVCLALPRLHDAMACNEEQRSFFEHVC